MQLSKELGITQKSAWFMEHRIRKAMGGDGNYILKGVVECDETFIGGKEKNKHSRKKLKNVEVNSVINTDESTSYIGLGTNYSHRVVNHSAKQYVDKMAYTNGVESVWALLKRGFYGTFHKFSVKHLERYTKEFDFRWNDGNCKFPTMDRVDSIAGGCWNGRLTWKELIE